MAEDGAKNPTVLISKAFAAQYYNVLHKQPADVHKFYREGSRLSRAEGLTSPLTSVSTVAGINTVILSQNYKDACAEIKSVDAQESLNGGVIVVVTGTMSYAHQSGRSFVQTFFLAPQEPKGLYVLNDIFRYTDHEASATQERPTGEAQEQGVEEEAVDEAGVLGVPDGPGTPQGHPSGTVPVRDVGVNEGSQQQQHQHEEQEQEQQQNPAGGGRLGPGARGEGMGTPEAYREGDRAAGAGGVAVRNISTEEASHQQQEPHQRQNQQLQQARDVHISGGNAGDTLEPVVDKPSLSQQLLLSPTLAVHPTPMPGPVSYASVTVTGTPSVTVTGHAIGRVHGAMPGRHGQLAAPLGVLHQPVGAPGVLGQHAVPPVGTLSGGGERVNALGLRIPAIGVPAMHQHPGSGGVPRLAPGQPSAGTAAAGTVGASEQLGEAPGVLGGAFNVVGSAGAGAPTPGLATDTGPGQAADGERLQTEGSSQMGNLDMAEATAEAARSVFLRHLTPAIRHAQIAELLRQFGSLKRESIKIRRGKLGNTTVFGFAEFEDTASAVAAAQKGFLFFEGHTVRIERKRSISIAGQPPASTATAPPGSNGRSSGRGDRQHRDGARVQAPAGDAPGLGEEGASRKAGPGAAEPGTAGTGARGRVTAENQYGAVGSGGEGAGPAAVAPPPASQSPWTGHHQHHQQQQPQQPQHKTQAQVQHQMQEGSEAGGVEGGGKERGEGRSRGRNRRGRGGRGRGGQNVNVAVDPAGGEG